MKDWDELSQDEKIDRCAEFICLLYKQKQDKPTIPIPGYEILEVKSNESDFRKRYFGRKW